MNLILDAIQKDIKAMRDARAARNIFWFLLVVSSLFQVFLNWLAKDVFMLTHVHITYWQSWLIAVVLDIMT